MRGHGLRVLERAAGFKIGGDACGAERMAADLAARAEIGGAALDHAIGVDTVHRFVRRRAGAPSRRAEEGSLAAVADSGRLDISVEIGFEIVVRRHLVALASFFMQPHPPAFALRVVVFNPHTDHGADPRKRKRHHRNHRPIPQADNGRRVDAAEKLARLVTGEYRGLTGLDDVLRTAHRMGRIGRDDLGVIAKSSRKSTLSGVEELGAANAGRGNGRTVPTNRQVETILNRVKHVMVDPSVQLDECDRWRKLWNELFVVKAN